MFMLSADFFFLGIPAIQHVLLVVTLSIPPVLQLALQSWPPTSFCVYQSIALSVTQLQVQVSYHWQQWGLRLYFLPSAISIMQSMNKSYRWYKSFIFLPSVLHLITCLMFSNIFICVYKMLKYIKVDFHWISECDLLCNTVVYPSNMCEQSMSRFSKPSQGDENRKARVNLCHL